MGVERTFSRRVGYAVHALSYMARTAPKEGLTTVPELSGWMRRVWPTASKTYLANVIRRLVHAGILISQRGVFGGYGFARPPSEITLRDVITVLEGFSEACCVLTPRGPCPVQHRCKNYHRLCRLQRQYASLLAEITIADLARDLAAPVPKTGNDDGEQQQRNSK